MNDEQVTIKTLRPEGHFGYKATRVGLVTLIIPEDANHNEDRKGIVNSDKAKFRCDRAFVERIVNIETGEEMSSDISMWNSSRFCYRVGHYAIAESYNEDKSVVCSGGIHYFLTEEMARNWHKFYDLYVEETPRRSLTADVEIYCNNGDIKETGKMVNGLKEGTWTYTSPVEICQTSEYLNGELHGTKTIYSNGVKEYEAEYEKGRQTKSKVFKRDKNSKIYMSEYIRTGTRKEIMFRFDVNDEIIEERTFKNYKATLIKHQRKNENGNVILTIEDLITKL